MNVEHVVAGARTAAAHLLRDAEAGAGGAIVIREKMDPKLLVSLRQAHNDLADVLGLPRMFDDLMADIKNSRVSGSTPEETLRLIVDKLRATTTRWEIRDELPPLRRIVSDLQVPQAMEPLRTQTLEQLQNNMDRLDGLVRDGFSTYPDYAELGRALAGSELLLSVHNGHTTASAGQAVGEALNAAAETLAW